MKMCEHTVASGTCYKCFRFEFDSASLHFIDSEEFDEVVLKHPITGEQKSLFVPKFRVTR